MLPMLIVYRVLGEEPSGNELSDHLGMTNIVYDEVLYHSAVLVQHSDN